MRTLRTITNCKVAGYIFLVIATLLIGIFLIHTADASILNAYGVSGIIFALIGGGLLLIAGWQKRRWWNNMSVNERCSWIAGELYDGERGWYLNCFLNTNYFFAPLKKSDMNEFGGGKHEPTTREAVLQLLKEGRIENDETTKLIIQHFDSIL